MYDQRVPTGAPTKFTFNGVSLLAAYMLLENNFNKLTRNTNDIDISFLRICQDTTNEIDNSDYALSVESKEIHDKIDFIMN